MIRSILNTLNICLVLAFNVGFIINLTSDDPQMIAYTTMQKTCLWTGLIILDVLMLYMAFTIHNKSGKLLLVLFGLEVIIMAAIGYIVSLPIQHVIDGM